MGRPFSIGALPRRGRFLAKCLMTDGRESVKGLSFVPFAGRFLREEET